MQADLRQSRVRYARRGEDIHACGPSVTQNSRACIRRRPGRHHIVNQQNRQPHYIAPHRHRSGQFGPSFRNPKLSQRHGRPQAPQRVLQHRPASHPPQLAGQQRRLIIAPLPQPRDMQRHRRQHISALQQLRPCPRHQPRQPARQIRAVGIFQRQDQPLCHLVIPQRRPRLRKRRRKRLANPANPGRTRHRAKRQRHPATAAKRRRDEIRPPKTRQTKLPVRRHRRIAGKTAGR